ncbi:MAG: hypothetical protein ACK55Z_12685, partial [bacterium]
KVNIDSIYFLQFLYIVFVNANTLFSPLVPAHEGLRELLPADSPQDPLPLFLELLLGHGDARQLLLQLGEEEVVCWGEVR